MRRMRLLIVVVALAGGVSACGHAANGGDVAVEAKKPAGPENPDPDPTAVPARVPPLKSPNLAITVDPRSGPPGTVVHIEVTGCNDPTGRNHAISFNNDPGNFEQRFAPNTVRTIEARQDGERLAADYTVVVSDRTGRSGRVYVQCSDGLATADFTVTDGDL